jgi:peptidoglycan/xylan/chitin deacetylase (PgdA/CDA1 family)
MSFCDKQRVWVATAFGKLRRNRVRRAGAMFVALVVGVVMLTPIAAEAAPGPVIVSLTFDDGLVNQFNLAYNAPNGLKDAAVPATFFVNSGTVNQGANFMTWSQLATLAAAGNDIGGKTVNALNLTTDPNPTTQVCQDRQNLMQHGITPVAFAYPGGATNAAVKGIVAGCGYGNARAASGLAVGTSTTGTSAETIPPADWFATRVYAPSANTLVNLQSIVTNANAKGGGWVQIVIRRVCDQTLDAANYVSCSGSSGRIELQDLKDFVTWVKGSAPAGTTFSTVAQLVKSADTAAPTTAIACNGAACSSSPYSGAVTVALTPTDSGSGVSSTHYTTDGSDPTLSSPTYSAPFGANSQTGTTTVKFRTWDLAGNAEATQTQVIQASPDTNAPVTSITCNGTTCGASYIDSVSIALSAVDSGDAGVAHTYYTTDGSTPTPSSTEYTAPFTLGLGTKTVRFFSVDNAGNAETPQSRVITVTPHATIVSLTLDDGGLSQYSLGYQHALQPRGAHATFFVNSGIVGASNNFMTWSQLSELQAAGNDIGGKTINSGNLTSLDSATATQQVCGDRQALIDHGITPAAFAYPGGATNAITKQIVSSCGYGNARTGGGLGPAQGGQNAEPLPPADWLATRAYAPSTITLANLQALVTNAASKGGGWAQIVLGKVCDATLDAANYGTCSASSSHVELSDLNAFLDWIGAAGQAGSAPAGVVLDTVANVAHTYDTISPTTIATCNGAPCTTDPYQGGLVRVTLSATDLGYGVASTHYTLDGSTPTLASPTYASTVTLTTGVTTLKLASWDASGNAEPPQTLTINVTDTPDITAPSTTIACDGAPCQSTNYDGGLTASFTASDNHAGSGVDRTFYTLDGSDPTTSSTAKQYTSPFMLAGNTTVKFFSRDFAGNNEPVVTQQLLMTPYPVVVSLTFDDQYANLYPYNRPLLLKYQMQSTI